VLLDHILILLTQDHTHNQLPSSPPTSPKSASISPSLFVHEGVLGITPLPQVVVLDQGTDGLLRQHGSDALEVLAVVLEGLLENHLVFHGPLL